MYGAEKGTMLGDKIKTTIYELFEEYKRMNEDVYEVRSTAQRGSKKGGSSSSSNLMARWWSVESAEDEEMNSELDTYLSEKVDKGESAFSTGGRVLDAFRSSLSRRSFKLSYVVEIGCEILLKCDIELTEEESEQMESDLTSNENNELALDGVVDTL
ncbi:hypothetical protein Dimus_012129 [Dionaea muscipula]